jgi:hypothetical protein
LFGGPNFVLDLKKEAAPHGVSRAQLWRPIKIGAVVAAVILAAGACGLVVLANRPNLGFVVNVDKELTISKSLGDLQEAQERELAGFEARHQDNLKTLARKHFFYQRDTAAETRNYRESLKTLDENARTAQASVALQALEKANIRCCVVDEAAADHWLDRPINMLPMKLALSPDFAGQAIDALKAVGFQARRLDAEIRITGLFNVSIPLTTDPRYGDILKNAVKQKVDGSPWLVESLADTLQWKTAAWRDAQRPAGDRDKELADIRQLVRSHEELQGELPSDVQQALK